MVICPACGTSMEADFGMTTCPACQSVFMVEIDGTVAPTEVSSEDPQDIGLEAATADEGDSFVGDDQDSPVSDSLSFQDPQDEPNVGGEFASPEFESSAEPTEIAEAPQFEAASEETIIEDEPVQEEESPTEYSEDFLDSMDVDAPKTDDKNDPLGVTAFDSNEASQMVDGPFYYDLIISGIDTAQLKQQVIDMLSDKRLNWSTDEIKKKIKMGQLQLPNLNPVRAVLAVLKLQTLDVDVEWSQRPYTAETDGPKDRET